MGGGGNWICNSILGLSFLCAFMEMVKTSNLQTRSYAIFKRGLFGPHCHFRLVPCLCNKTQCLFSMVHFLIESLQSVEQQEESHHLSRDSKNIDFGDSRNPFREKTSFIMTPFSVVYYPSNSFWTVTRNLAVQFKISLKEKMSPNAVMLSPGCELIFSIGNASVCKDQKKAHKYFQHKLFGPHFLGPAKSEFTCLVQTLRGDVEARKRGPKKAILGHKSSVCCFFPAHR